MSKFSYKFLAAALGLAMLGSVCLQPITAHAITAAEKEAAEQAERERQEAYNKLIDSNQVENWPQGPQIYAESAVVIEASTGTILYNKDMDQVNYPASITKIMTALLTVENCAMDEVVTYSYYATHSIEVGSSSIGTTEGEELTVEESLYALLLMSANECGNGLAEHIAGSVEAFADMMNAKAAELGCTNTHFVNPHGLPDDNHYTTAHDMALILKAALQNEHFVRIAGTAKYNMRATNKDDEITYMTNHHYMIAPYRGVTRYLDDTVIAGKTGYTDLAMGTLVTAAERNGMTLLVVTMHTRPTGVYGTPLFDDTALLLDYASENFSKLNVAANETNFSLENSGFFHTGSSIFGQYKPLIEIDRNDDIILPNGASFSDASPELIFADNEDSNLLATLKYTYYGKPIGSASIRLAESKVQEFTFDKETGEEDTSGDTKNTEPKRFIKINVRLILILAAIAAILLLFLLIFRRLTRSFHISLNLISRERRRRRRKRRSRRSRPRTRRQPPGERYHRTPKRRPHSGNDLDL
ncbi:MAG: D-alanyl-D-alanine carboxypeptidase [Lachnospiraceae bacterium]|nr:D-alanyl-D-alanine carboxypeptidase [Lachnospiraceae bacterium]